jgi:hypothetical protein
MAARGEWYGGRDGQRRTSEAGKQQPRRAAVRTMAEIRQRGSWRREWQRRESGRVEMKVGSTGEAAAAAAGDDAPVFLTVPRRPRAPALACWQRHCHAREVHWRAVDNAHSTEGRIGIARGTGARTKKAGGMA